MADNESGADAPGSAQEDGSPKDREGHETDTSSKMSALKKPWLRIALGVTVVLALIGGAAWIIEYLTVGRYQQDTDNAYIQADVVTVSPRVAGYVEKVFVTDNQQVKAGQPLLQIAARDYSAQAEQISAQIDVSLANIDAANAQIGEQQAAIDRARSDLAAAQSSAAFAQGEVSRYAPLAATGAESRERLTELQDRGRQARDQVSGARAALSSAERRIATLQAQVKQAQSQGKASRAQLAAANVNVQATLVRASVDGRVGDKTVRVGQFVQPGTRMMSVVPQQNAYIVANFKETQVGLMRAGQPVTFEVDALPGVEIHGRVDSIAPGTGAQFSILPPLNATGNFTKIVQRIPVRLAIDASPEVRGLLVPGMSVEASVDTRSGKSVFDRARRD